MNSCLLDSIEAYLFKGSCGLCNWISDIAVE